MWQNTASIDQLIILNVLQRAKYLRSCHEIFPKQILCDEEQLKSKLVLTEPLKSCHSGRLIILWALNRQTRLFYAKKIKRMNLYVFTSLDKYISVTPDKNDAVLTLDFVF